MNPKLRAKNDPEATGPADWSAYEALRAAMTPEQRALAPAADEARIVRGMAPLRAEALGRGCDDDKRAAWTAWYMADQERRAVLVELLARWDFAHPRPIVDTSTKAKASASLDAQRDHDTARRDYEATAAGPRAVEPPKVGKKKAAA